MTVSESPVAGLAQAGPTLARLASGTRARVAGFLPIGADLADRLVEMGFDEGAEVEILHRAPLGDPIAVRVDGTTVALRVALASRILLGDADMVDGENGEAEYLEDRG